MFDDIARYQTIEVNTGSERLPFDLRRMRARRHRRIDQRRERRGFARENRTGDQHDAYSVAAWLRAADRDGSLAEFFAPPLTAEERTVASIEGGILGIK